MTDWSAQRIWDDMIVAYIREGQFLAAQGHEASANNKLCIAFEVLVRHYQRGWWASVCTCSVALSNTSKTSPRRSCLSHTAGGWQKAQERLAQAMMVRQGSYQGWGMS